LPFLRPEFGAIAVPLTLDLDGDQLYAGVKQLIAEHLDALAEERIVPAFPRSSGTHGAGKLGGGAEAIERAMEGDRFLKAVKGVWEDHTGSMRKLKDILRYMVRLIWLRQLDFAGRPPAIAEMC
jgi:cullin 3